ncbi:MAG TPA: hypothetical protein VGU63_07880, partial [Candidatus Acidoferrales bacterium]|nr:hypothetical protein [Candidatus Acidoferrales bacterium]
MDQRDPRNNIDHLIAIGDVAMALRNLREFWNQNRSASGGEFIASRYELLREHLRLIPFRVAILRDCCTLEPAIPILRAGAYTYGIDLTTHLGGFNAYRDEMVNQGSPLYHFAPDAVVLFLDIAELVPDLWHEYSDLSSSQRRSAI